MGTAPVVSLSRVTKRFATAEGALTVLDQTDFQLDNGDVALLMGPSGCGKSTLLSVASGILSVDSGDVALCGNRLTGMDYDERALVRQHHLGFVFQKFHLVNTLSAADNICVPLMIRGAGYRCATRTARDLVARVELAGLENRFPGELSGGQQQRIAIARAVASNPDIVICDEPTASLDTTAGVKILQLLRDLARDTRCAILIVSHDPTVARFVDKQFSMSAGKVWQHA